MFAFNDRCMPALFVASLALVSTALTSAQNPGQTPSSSLGTTQTSARQDEVPGMSWVDPATGLRWTLQDNGSDVNWDGAKKYCQTLNVGGVGG